MFDADILIGHYPFRPFPSEWQDPTQVKERLLQRGIQRACIASLNAIFYPAPEQGDQELLPHVLNDAFFLPVGTVNPTLHNWRETLTSCVEEYGCRMVRLLPNYHLYSLSDAFVNDFLDEVARLNVVICIVKRIEDERMHHLLMKVPAVTNDEIIAVAERYRYPIVVLSAYLNEINELAASSQHLYFDIAFAETLNTMKRLTEQVSSERLLFSTHTPFFYPEAAIDKVKQWDTSNADRNGVCGTNLARLLQLG